MDVFTGRAIRLQEIAPIFRISQEERMAHRSLSELAQKMRNIDIAMLSTHTGSGDIASRPMSNNGEVEYDGTSYYFTFEAAHSVQDISENPKVGLSFQSKGIQVAVEGTATLIRDKAPMREHWSPDLDKWFEDGIDTPDIVMIQVDATRVHYWEGEEDGEVQV